VKLNTKTRLGSLSSWNAWVLSWIIGIRLIAALVSDPNRTGNFSPLWFVIWVVVALETLLIIYMVLGLGLRKRLKRKPSVVANMLLGAFIGASANLSTGGLAILTGIDTEGLWHVRAVGGALSFPLAFILLNNLRGAIIERNENIAKLSEVENELLGYRDSAKQVLLDANESMRAKTIAQVSPAIENIDRLLQGRTEDKTRLDLIDELRNVIRDQIRPISRSLQETAEKLSMPERRLVEKPTAVSAFSRSFNLRRSLKLMPAMLLLVLGFPMVAFLVIDSKSMFRGLLGALAFAAVMATLRLLVPKNKEFKTAAGLALLTVLVAISVLPGFLITYFRYGLTGEVITNGFWMLGTALGAFGLTAYARGLDALQAKFAVELEQFNDKFNKEVALFEQKLWLERRAWSYIIHGDVQGALSAALTRLQRSDKLEPFEIEMVKQDLQRAKVALTKPASREIDLSAGIDELVRSWSGVCEIQVESSARATRAIDSNRDIRNCINEICKEAISNAVRHGNAKNAWIHINREQDDIIELEVCNDGHTLLRDQPNGMGLSMIDDLSLSWQLTAERHKGKTCLVAQLPISNKTI
jgi:anti-sigma regulatory factor (Ser/Thr protein kinase)